MSVKGCCLDRLVFTISSDGGDYEMLASASGVISYSEFLDEIDSYRELKRAYGRW